MFSLFKEKRKKKVNDFSYLGSNIQTTKNYIHFYPNWTKNIHHRTWHVLCTNFFKKPYFIQTISQINVQFWLVRACIWENNVNAYEYVYGPLKQISAIVKKRRLQLAGHVFLEQDIFRTYDNLPHVSNRALANNLLKDTGLRSVRTQSVYARHLASSFVPLSWHRT